MATCYTTLTFPSCKANPSKGIYNCTDPALKGNCCLSEITPVKNISNCPVGFESNPAKGQFCEVTRKPYTYVHKCTRITSCANKLFDPKTSCKSCLNPLLDFKSGCTKCKNSLFAAPKCDSCSNPLLEYPDCMACSNPDQDIGTECQTCTNPLLEYPGCVECADNKLLAPQSCTTCLDPDMVAPACTCPACPKSLSEICRNDYDLDTCGRGNSCVIRPVGESTNACMSPYDAYAMILNVLSREVSPGNVILTLKCLAQINEADTVHVLINDKFQETVPPFRTSDQRSDRRDGDEFFVSTLYPYVMKPEQQVDVKIQIKTKLGQTFITMDHKGRGTPFVYIPKRYMY